MYQTPGSIALLLSVLVVTGFAITGLLGWTHPVTGAAVGLGAQVVGTIAFFASYYMGRGDEDAETPATVQQGVHDLSEGEWRSETLHSD